MTVSKSCNKTRSKTLIQNIILYKQFVSNIHTVTAPIVHLHLLYYYNIKIKDGLSLPVYYKIVTRNFRYSYCVRLTCYRYKLLKK